MSPNGLGAAGPQVNVRRNVYSLDPGGPEIAALRRGIAEMMRRSQVNPADPTGWLYQANIHGTTDRPLLPVWATCQHGSFFFLSWHRMYLYFFERILRRASGDPGLALPYWDYSGSARQSALPRAFRDPADPSNPLYVRERNPGINRGERLPPSVVSFAEAFRYSNFHSPTGSDESFGGQILRRPEHVTGVHGRLESAPHDAIHGQIGGRNGWMSRVTLAARDPIFWLHHANIDRLWKRWLDLGNNNPGHEPAEEVWWSHPFTFFDEGGVQVTMTARASIDTLGQLGYRYEDDPPPIPAIRFARDIGAMRAESAAEEQPPEVIVGTSAQPVELGDEPVTVSIPMQPTAATELVAALQPAAGAEAGPAERDATRTVQGRVLLHLTDITFDEPPGVTYDVYLDLPEGEEPSYHSPYFIGTLAFFGMEPMEHDGHQQPADGRRSYDITGNALVLSERGEWSSQQVQVTFVRSELLPPLPGDETPAADAAPATGAAPAPEAPPPRIRIGAVSVAIEPGPEAPPGAPPPPPAP